MLFSSNMPFSNNVVLRLVGNLSNIALFLRYVSNANGDPPFHCVLAKLSSSSAPAVL